MGEGVHNNESFVTFTFETSTIHTSTIIPSTIKTYITETSIALTHMASPLTTSIQVSTISPTYSIIMHDPITTVFFSHPIEAERMIPDEEPVDDEITVSFVNLQFDPEEENDPDDLIMPGKQFKILNSKINFLLQLQADTGGKNFMTVVEMKSLLKKQENHIQSLVESIEQK
ncbi:unnamed protein product [Lactuca saligna]|uniref:Uncharacterized protein n=1 Tax=Lactuca saligna TaxID=75948 RepID=A0AA35Y9D3_LACSI|nr:unnamed protein product [Lactuca saligna]